MAPPSAAQTFTHFADYLCQRRDELTRRWAETVRADPKLPSSEPLSRVELQDHMPLLFDDLSDTTRQASMADTRASTDSHAAAHGRHRWQQRYRLAEVFRELFLIRGLIIRDGLGTFLRENPACEPHSRAMETLIYRFFEETAVNSVEQFVEDEQQAQHDLHNRLSEASAALARTDASRLQMLRTVSHEMGNMLHALNGAISVLSMEYEDLDAVERREMLDICQRNMTDLKTLLHHLTDFSAFLRGKAQREVQLFFLPNLFAELVTALRPQAEAQKLQFEATLDPALGDVRTDRLRIKQIVTNLVSNAIKYRQRTRPPTSPPSRVALTYRTLAGKPDAPDQADCWQIVVEDNGVGIAPDQHEAIFEEFHRLSPNSEAPGAGLGLAISRRLAELLEGTITVESEPGRGSRFEATFPRLLPLP